MLTFQFSKKSLLFIPLLAIALISVISCSHQEVDSQQVATVLNKPNSDITKERDEKFLVQAAEINFEEIMLGKLAQQRTTSDDIKAMAKMFEETHRSANTEVHAMAMTKTIAVPTAATRNVMEDYDQLNLKATKEFDQEYCSMIVKSHQDAIHCFESYTSGPSDQDIKVWALGMIPELRIHLQKATEMELQMRNGISEAITEGKRISG